MTVAVPGSSCALDGAGTGATGRGWAVSMRRGADGWAGVTTFQGTTQSADDWRVGVRLYRRPAAGNE